MSLQLAIISRDRAAQLDMLLASLAANTRATAIACSVLYESTTAAFEAGYARVRALHPSAHFERQHLEDLNGQLAACARDASTPFFSLFADDLVVIRPFDPADREFATLLARDDIAALSLRLNPRVDYSQPLDLKVVPPSFGADRTWRWTVGGPGIVGKIRRRLRWWARGDWAVPFVLDGNVYRRAAFAKYLCSLPKIPSIPQLEPMMVAHPPRAPRMLCYAESKIVSLAMNSMDLTHNYPSAGTSLDEINGHFLDGRRLAFDTYANLEAQQCHVPVTPVWA